MNITLHITNVCNVVLYLMNTYHNMVHFRYASVRSFVGSVFPLTFCNEKSEWLQNWYIACYIRHFRSLWIFFYLGHCDLLSLICGSKFTFPLWPWFFGKWNWLFLITMSFDLHYRYMVSTIEAFYWNLALAICQQWPWPIFFKFRG